MDIGVWLITSWLRRRPRLPSIEDQPPLSEGLNSNDQRARTRAYPRMNFTRTQQRGALLLLTGMLVLAVTRFIYLP